LYFFNEKKWLSYFKNIPPLYLVAIVFDPRCKIDVLCDYLTIYYEVLNLDVEDNVNINVVMHEVKQNIMQLYNEFVQVSSSSTSTSTSSHSNIQQFPTQRVSGVGVAQQVLLQRQKRTRESSSFSEFDNYLTTSFEFGDDYADTDFPILDWWSRHANTFPILSLLAKQILAAPVSTVAVEQAFSQGGNILDETRSRMTPDSLEAQACVDDWTKAELRAQENPKENEDLFDLYDGSSTGTSTGGANSD